MTKPEDYTLSKDWDVALWVDYRAFHGEPELEDAVDFVIVDSQLHDQFDQFKRAEVKPSHSLLPMVELLRFYCLSKCPHEFDCSIVVRFGKTYLEMHEAQIDQLVVWVSDMRDQYYGVEGESIFAGGRDFDKLLEANHYHF